MNNKITYILPSRSRPAQFFAFINNLIDYSASDNFEIICVLDEDDESMSSQYASNLINALNTKGISVTAHYGKSKSKIDACNREIDKISPDTDIVCLASDDFIMTEKGFDEHIRLAFQDGFKGLAHFPDNRIAHIPQKVHAIAFSEWMRLHEWKHSPRGTWYKGATYFDKSISDVYEYYVLELKQQLVTFPVMHVEYLRRFGYIYHPDYKSVKADDEQTEVAKRLSLYRYIDKQIMEHQHYRWGFHGGQPDALYKRNDNEYMYFHDKAIFEERSHKNFDL